MYKSFPQVEPRFYQRSTISTSAEALRICMIAVENDRRTFIKSLDFPENYGGHLERVADYDFVIAELAQALSDIYQAPRRFAAHD